MPIRRFPAPILSPALAAVALVLLTGPAPGQSDAPQVDRDPPVAGREAGAGADVSTQGDMPESAGGNTDNDTGDDTDNDTGPETAQAGDAPVDQDPAPGDSPTMEALIEAYRAGDYVTARAGLARLAPDGTPDAKYRYGRILFEGRGGPRDLAGAAHWLGQAAQENHVAATTLLARLYMAGAGVEQDPARAALLFERAATRGDATAQFLLGESLRLGQGSPQNHAKAFNWFLAAAEQQSPEAQFALSRAYADGLGIEPDPAQALRWLEEAATGGLPRAQFTFALALEAGAADAAPAPEAALSWYRRAAESGHPDAQRILGTRYLRGDGVEQNSPEGLRWLTAAAEAGDAGAMSNLGWAHATGTGVAADDAVAFAWYQRAADRGLLRAMVALAAFHETGRGTPRDLALAVRLYREALEHGDGNARVPLGLLAARGEIDDLVAPQEAAAWVGAAAAAGDAEAIAWLERQSEQGIRQAQGRLADHYLAQDGREEAALALFREAAQGGDVFSQYRLGQMHAEGTGVAQDYVQAHKWFNVAATHGLSNAAEMREVISQLMTPAQIAEAQALARDIFEAEAAPLPGIDQDEAEDATPPAGRDGEAGQ